MAQFVLHGLSFFSRQTWTSSHGGGKFPRSKKGQASKSTQVSACITLADGFLTISSENKIKHQTDSISNFLKVAQIISATEGSEFGHSESRAILSITRLLKLKT